MEDFEEAMQRADQALQTGSTWLALTALRDALVALRPLLTPKAEES
jgi:hypothetical protein